MAALHISCTYRATARISSERSEKYRCRVLRPTPAAVAMSLNDAAGLVARTAVAASRIAFRVRDRTPVSNDFNSAMRQK